MNVNLLKYKKLNIIERIILNSNTLKGIYMNGIPKTALLRWIFVHTFFIDMKQLEYIIFFIDNETIN